MTIFILDLVLHFRFDLRASLDIVKFGLHREILLFPGYWHRISPDTHVSKKVKIL